MASSTLAGLNATWSIYSTPCLRSNAVSFSWAGEIAPEDISEELFSSCLYTAGLPDPDLVIRTGDEKRISNFLLWQAAYAEILFHPAMWPDFSTDVFLECLEDYMARERRFGKVKNK